MTEKEYIEKIMIQYQCSLQLAEKIFISLKMNQDLKYIDTNRESEG